MGKMLLHDCEFSWLSAGGDGLVAYLDLVAWRLSTLHLILFKFPEKSPRYVPVRRSFIASYIIHFYPSLLIMVILDFHSPTSIV